MGDYEGDDNNLHMSLSILIDVEYVFETRTILLQSWNVFPVQVNVPCFKSSWNRLEATNVHPGRKVWTCQKCKENSF